MVQNAGNLFVKSNLNLSLCVCQFVVHLLWMKQMKMVRVLKFSREILDDFCLFRNIRHFFFAYKWNSCVYCVDGTKLTAYWLVCDIIQHYILTNEWMKKSKSISIDCSKSANSRNKLLLVFRFCPATTMRSFKMRNEIHCTHFDHTNPQSHVTMYAPGRD